jgi:hypothetical protein
MAATLIPEAAPLDAERLFGTDPPIVILEKSINAVTKGSDGVFGVNVPVAAEFTYASKMFVEQVVESRNADSDVERQLRVLVTSAGKSRTLGGCEETRPHLDSRSPFSISCQESREIWCRRHCSIRT